MSRTYAALLIAVLALAGCGKGGGKDDAKMAGKWEAEVSGIVQHLASADSLKVGAFATFTEDGKVEIKLEDGKSKGFSGKGGFELNGTKLKLNIIPFGGQKPQTVELGEGGDSFTMESIAGQLTFYRM